MAVAVPAIAFPLLLAFWVFVGWRVRVERGVVHRSRMAMFARALTRLGRDMVAAFSTPGFRETATRVNDFNRAWREAERRVARELEARLALPADLRVEVDRTPLLPEGGTE